LAVGTPREPFIAGLGQSLGLGAEPEGNSHP